jgi:hypothetical protein
MMRIVIGALLSLTIGMGAALAQAPATTPSTAPTAAPAKMSPDDKKAISKSCSEQATAKGLHGKERKKFRSECKHNAGKPS